MRLQELLQLEALLVNLLLLIVDGRDSSSQSLFLLERIELGQQLKIILGILLIRVQSLSYSYKTFALLSYGFTL